MLAAPRGRERKQLWAAKRETKSTPSVAGELWCRVWRPVPRGLSRCPLLSWNLLCLSWREQREPW